jgi:cell division cycle 2-like
VTLRGISFEHLRHDATAHRRPIDDCRYFSSPDIFYEWMDAGNLHHYIHSNFYVHSADTDNAVFVLEKEPTQAALFTRRPFQAKSNPRSIAQIKYILKSVLEGLVLIHQLGIIHRDLKPSNILLTKQNDVKICDFGLAIDMNNSTGSESIDNMCHLVYTYCYRAPEVYRLALDREKAKPSTVKAKKGKPGAADYDTKADVFAFGLIVEFLEADLKNQIHFLFDFSSLYKLEKSLTAYDYSKMVENIKKFHEHNQFFILMQLWKAMNEDFLAFDLFLRLTISDPSLRLSAAEALQHPYFHENPNAREFLNFFE